MKTYKEEILASEIIHFYWVFEKDVIYEVQKYSAYQNTFLLHKHVTSLPNPFLNWRTYNPTNPLGWHGLVPHTKSLSKVSLCMGPGHVWEQTRPPPEGWGDFEYFKFFKFFNFLNFLKYLVRLLSSRLWALSKEPSCSGATPEGWRDFEYLNFLKFIDFFIESN